MINGYATTQFAQHVQLEGLVPGGVQVALDGAGLLFALAAWVRDELQLHVGVRKAVGIHGDQVPGLFDWKGQGERGPA